MADKVTVDSTVVESKSVPQFNTLPRTFEVKPNDWGTNYRYQPEDLAPGGFLGGELQVDDEAVKQAEAVAELNKKDLPELVGIDASFPGSPPAAIYAPNPQVNDATGEVVKGTDPAVSLADTTSKKSADTGNLPK